MRSIVLLILIIISLPGRAQEGELHVSDSPKRDFKITNADPRLKATTLRRIFIGNNYRTEWTDSVKVPVLQLKTDFNGLTPEKEGGGKETKTLHLKDDSDRKWVVRSVRKYPEKIIPPQLRRTIAEDIVRDGISASYPYAVLSVGTLAKAAGVPYMPNTLVYIPDDALLGEFRSKYKNTLALLELRTIEANRGDKELETEEIVRGVQRSGDHKVDQRALLRARLLDNFIMDFDRHDDQWQWVQKDTTGATWYEPIPKDRDQAFFRGNGFIPRLISHKPPMGPLQGMRAKTKNIETFNYSAWSMDQSFLNELDETVWDEEIDRFLGVITDAVIDSALMQQPLRTGKYHAQQIAELLKNKRRFFKADMKTYYRFLSCHVLVVGTNNADLFTVTNNADGTVTVQVEDEQAQRIFYKRVFDPSTTKEIRLYGLEGNDQFLVTGAASPIKIRLIGGAGKDTFSNASSSNRGHIFAYDYSAAGNTIKDGGIKNKFSNDSIPNEYNRNAKSYNSSSFGLVPEYSFEGGLFLGPSFKRITAGFGKTPYASKHFLYATKAFSSAAWHLHYEAEYIKVIDKIDLVFKSDAQLPTVRTDFFGWGNNTAFDKSKGPDYYNVRYIFLNASLAARHWLRPWLHLEYGPLLQYFKVTAMKNNDKYLEAVYPTAFNNAIYQGQWYTGAALRAVVDTRNNELMPTKGIYANAYTKQVIGFSNTTEHFNETGGSFAFYTDAILKDRVVLAVAFGANSNFGDFEFPQAQYLGFKQNLRGFRYQRFAGRTRAYNNTELRVNLGDLNCYIFKGPVGVLAFHDIGRVWMDQETSSAWHRGYGGGIWLAPFRKMLVTGNLTFSAEEKAFPLVTLGFQF